MTKLTEREKWLMREAFEDGILSDVDKDEYGVPADLWHKYIKENESRLTAEAPEDELVSLLHNIVASEGWAFFTDVEVKILKARGVEI